MASRAEQGWITVTELADTLVRDHAVPFKTSHTIASRLIAEAQGRPGASLAAILREVSAQVTGRAIDYDEATLAWLLSAKHFIEVRRTPGGPAPAETARASRASDQVLAADEDWLREQVGKLRSAEEALRDAVARL